VVYAAKPMIGAVSMHVRRNEMQIVSLDVASWRPEAEIRFESCSDKWFD